ncbi:MAG TPA: GNAT family N-acetyltransferase [Azoarcus sp.]|nr:GNAT family N-acetyltransferase [Azoarcus sp.]
MNNHYLAPLFQPRAIAVIGSGARDDSIAALTVRNLVEAGFGGRIHAVCADAMEIAGIRCTATLDDTHGPIDLAVLGVAIHEASKLLGECARVGVKVVILPAGFDQPSEDRADIIRTLRETARRHGIRLLGPNALGVIRPSLGLNASIAHTTPHKGGIGLISQSGALASAVLDWAGASGIGFSTVVTVGASIDLDFGDALDYLVSDPRTSSIVLYIERIRHARRFMTALRAAARIKPVMILKTGRHAGVAASLHAQVGMPAGGNDAFEAAIQRCGVVRLYNLTQLYAAARALFTDFRPRGNRLAIITNGSGLGYMAADRAADLKIPLADFSPTAREEFARLIGNDWLDGNPVDLGRTADADRYRRAVTIALESPHVDSVVAIYTPQTTDDPDEIARAVAEAGARSSKPLVACWIGEKHVTTGRNIFRAAGIPSFRTPEPAIELVGHITSYYRNQKLLLQVPGPLSHLGTPDSARARAAIQDALAENRTTLSETETKICLDSFAIPTETHAPRLPGRTLSITVERDAIFGPLIGLGENARQTRAYAMPPLNGFLARDLIRSMATAWAGATDADTHRNALELMLLRISEMICELPEINALSLTLDPALDDENGVVALDSRIVIEPAPPSAGRYEHMAIHPYPAHLAQQWELDDGTVLTVRPIRPEDAALTAEFVDGLSAQTRYLRFMNSVRKLSPAMMVRLTQIDYDREMAFVATTRLDGREIQLGVCRYAANPDGRSCEFAIVMADAWQGRGIAHGLMRLLIHTARERGFTMMEGVFLASNERMLRFVEHFGFQLRPDPEDPSLKVGTLVLRTNVEFPPC